MRAMNWEELGDQVGQERVAWVVLIIRFAQLRSTLEAWPSVEELCTASQAQGVLLAEHESSLCSFWGLDPWGAGSVGFEGQNQFPQ